MQTNTLVLNSAKPKAWNKALPTKDASTTTIESKSLILLVDVSYVMAVELLEHLMDANCDVRIAIRKGTFASLDEYEILELEQMGATVIILDYDNDRIEDSAAFKGVTKVLVSF
jgi:hypothetical protein